LNSEVLNESPITIWPLHTIHTHKTRQLTVFSVSVGQKLNISFNQTFTLRRNKNSTMLLKISYHTTMPMTSTAILQITRKAVK
jgi:hypothetical protein